MRIDLGIFEKFFKAKKHTDESETDRLISSEPTQLSPEQASIDIKQQILLLKKRSYTGQANTQEFYFYLGIMARAEMFSLAAKDYLKLTDIEKHKMTGVFAEIKQKRKDIEGKYGTSNHYDFLNLQLTILETISNIYYSAFSPKIIEE